MYVVVCHFQSHCYTDLLFTLLRQVHCLRNVRLFVLICDLGGPVFIFFFASFLDKFNFTFYTLIKYIIRDRFSSSTRLFKKGKRKVQGVPQSQTAALPRPHEEEETDKSKQAQTEQTYEKH